MKALDRYFFWAAIVVAVATFAIVSPLYYRIAPPDVQFWMRQALGALLLAMATVFALSGVLRLAILWAEFDLRSVFLQIGRALASAGVIYTGVHLGLLGLDQAGWIEPPSKDWWPGIPPHALMWFFAALLFLLIAELIVFLVHVALFKLSQWRTPGREQ